MKLIVTGATGFVGTEVIRQALRNSAIISDIALARKPVSLPDNAGPHAETSKFSSVILEDWINPYPLPIQEAIKGADACIWYRSVSLSLISSHRTKSNLIYRNRT